MMIERTGMGEERGQVGMGIPLREGVEVRLIVTLQKTTDATHTPHMHDTLKTKETVIIIMTTTESASIPHCHVGNMAEAGVRAGARVHPTVITGARPHTRTSPGETTVHVRVRVHARVHRQIRVTTESSGPRPRSTPPAPIVTTAARLLLRAHLTACAVGVETMTLLTSASVNIGKRRRRRNVGRRGRIGIVRSLNVGAC